MNLFLKIILFLIIFQSNSYSLNFYKYPKTNLGGDFCNKLYENLNEPNFPYSREDPIIVKADLLIEDIHSINGKDLDFESSFTLWAHWKDERVANTLKNMGSYTSEGKPLYLCDFSPTQVIGETRKIFDPVVEFFNRKGKPNFQYGMQDWIEIFSDGTVQSRLRDKTKFKANFDFRRFPFDQQTLSFELWSEFPSFMVEIIPDEPAMTEYKDTLYAFGDQEDGIIIPGWDLVDVKYENYSYVENDGYPYTGFMLYLDVQRQSSYYLFKIILPIILYLLYHGLFFGSEGPN